MEHLRINLIFPSYCTPSPFHDKGYFPCCMCTNDKMWMWFNIIICLFSLSILSDLSSLGCVLRLHIWKVFSPVFLFCIFILIKYNSWHTKRKYNSTTVFKMLQNIDFGPKWQINSWTVILLANTTTEVRWNEWYIQWQQSNRLYLKKIRPCQIKSYLNKHTHRYTTHKLIHLLYLIKVRQVCLMYSMF